MNFFYISSLFMTLLVPVSSRIDDDKEQQKQIARMIGMLDDPNPEFRMETAVALAKKGQSAVPALKEALKDKSKTIRIGAIWTLDMIEPPPKDLVSLFFGMTRDSEPWVVREAYERLIRFDPTPENLPASLRETGRKEATLRYFVLDALRHLEVEDPDSIAFCRASLKDDREDVRAVAADLLRRIGLEAKIATPELIAALADKRISVLYCTALALHTVNPRETGAAVKALRDALKDDYDIKRKIAGETLTKIEQPAAESPPVSYEPFSSAKKAAEALPQLDPKAVPILVKMLADERRGHRRVASDALGRIDPKASDALPALQEAIKDQKPTVRCAIIDACAKIDLEKSQKFILNALNDKAWSVRFAALKALSKITNPSEEVKSSIKKMQTDEDLDVRELATSVLARK
jgi:HEAT repeat protein